MNIDNVGFNIQWVAGMDEKGFLKEMSLACYAHIYKGDLNREKKLKEVHKLCTAAQRKMDAVVLNNS